MPRFCHHDTRGPPSIFLAQKTATIADFPIRNRGDAYVKPWTQPWNAAHAAGPVSRPLRHNGQPYAGINVLTLWASAMERHYAAPIWMIFRQALELGGQSITCTASKRTKQRVRHR